MSTPNPNNPPQYSPTARGFLDSFSAAKYASQLKTSEHMPKIIKAELDGSIDANEREVAIRALEHCRDLMKPNPPFGPPTGPTPNTPQSPWSPSDVLDSIQEREPDFRERQLPPGDRE